MNSTQQQIHIIQQLLNGALLECYWIFCSFVLLSLLNHIRHLHKHSIKAVPLADVSVDQELLRIALEDITAQAKRTQAQLEAAYEANLQADMKLYSVKKLTVTAKQPSKDYTIRQLKAFASQQHIPKYSNMTKAELFKVIDFSLINAH